MPDEQAKFNNTQYQDNQRAKRYLSRQLIQHIMALYDSIIQKIEHGIGLLWEQYFSKQLFSIAKMRLQHDLINDMTELNDWFEKISTNIRDKVSNLSANLLSHFDEIIQQEVQFLYPTSSRKLSLVKSEILEEQQIDKGKEILFQNKLNQSLYQTCTESSRGKPKKPLKQRLQTVSSQSICSDDFSKSFIEDQTILIGTPDKRANITIVKSQQKIPLNSQQKRSKSSPRKLSKISQNSSQQHQQEVEGGFYGVFLSLLEAFDM